MVALNLTFFVQLTAFLIFLWIMNRAVIRPILRTMDERARRIAADLDAAQQDGKDAQEFEARHIAALTSAHGAAAARVHQARLSAYEEHRTTVMEHRREADEQVAQYHEVVAKQLEAERKRFPDLVASLTESIDHQVGPGGRLLR